MSIWSWTYQQIVFRWYHSNKHLWRVLPTRWRRKLPGMYMERNYVIHPMYWTLKGLNVSDDLQGVLNAAARVITGSRKFDRGLGQILHDQLHWLDVPDRVLFKLALTVHQFLNGRAPPYLSGHYIPVSSADTRRHLRSANRHLLAILRFRLNTYGRRAFSVAGPMAWNSLPDFIRDLTNSADCFSRLLKTYLFARY